MVRGRDWEVDDEDGGEGHVGTVLEISEPFNGGRRPLVQWTVARLVGTVVEWRGSLTSD